MKNPALLVVGVLLSLAFTYRVAPEAAICLFIMLLIVLHMLGKQAGR